MAGLMPARKYSRSSPVILTCLQSFFPPAVLRRSTRMLYVQQYHGVDKRCTVSTTVVVRYLPRQSTAYHLPFRLVLPSLYLLSTPKRCWKSGNNDKASLLKACCRSFTLFSSLSRLPCGEIGDVIKILNHAIITSTMTTRRRKVMT